MRNKINIAIVLFIITTSAFSQANKVYIDTGSVKNQFDYLIDKSYSYKDYKNIKLNWLVTLKNNVSDTLAVSKKEILTNYKTINSQKTTIDSLRDSLVISKKNTTVLSNEKQSISFLGIQFSKSFFKTLMVLIICGLAALLTFFIIQYKQSYSIIKQAESNLKETEEEFETHRKRALEREQKVMRKLQDELNKQKKE
ncbi:MAG: hypothetical protein GQ540_02660 [Lutibacter sp.]|uniref:hypothetical protein n=1 Tax=Lutibacter sp. TaxID=1925666 RepID=UPI001A01D891|nr:hypothetical protein [Lutibacter sp.]NOR27410.1 hypothetical protein [Lutibacter sp.]